MQISDRLRVSLIVCALIWGARSGPPTVDVSPSVSKLPRYVSFQGTSCSYKIFCDPQSAIFSLTLTSLFVSLSWDRTYFRPTSTFLSRLETVCLYRDGWTQSMNDFNRNRKSRPPPAWQSCHPWVHILQEIYWFYENIFFSIQNSKFAHEISSTDF